MTDPRKLLIKVVGTSGGLSRADVFSSESVSASVQVGGLSANVSASIDSGYFRTMVASRIKSSMAKIIKANHISVLELDEHVDLISSALREAINPELEEYGLTMPELYVANIVTPDDDPSFRRMKQQHADLYLKTREEEIKKAEALEMKMKGYTYQQETSRQVGLEAMKNGGAAGGLSGMTGEMMQMGVGLGVMGGVIGMTKEAVSPVTQQMGGVMQQAANVTGWDCPCGQKGIMSNFCPNCGAKKPEPPKRWNCACGKTGIEGRFCPECGAKKPE